MKHKTKAKKYKYSSFILGLIERLNQYIMNELKRNKGGEEKKRRSKRKKERKK